MIFKGESFKSLKFKQKREKLNEEYEAYQSNIKATFDKKTKKDSFKTEILL
jgi:hypothetical protein